MGGHPVNAKKALPGKDMISDGLLVTRDQEKNAVVTRRSGVFLAAAL
jgi:hypothetical protein